MKRGMVESGELKVEWARVGIIQRFCQRPRIIKSEVILNGASAWASAVGRCAVKDPVECLQDVRSRLNTFSELTGSFDSAPPRLRPRGAPLRMTAILMRLLWRFCFPLRFRVQDGFKDCAHAPDAMPLNCPHGTADFSQSLESQPSTLNCR